MAGKLMARLFHEEQWGVGLIRPDAFWRAVERGRLSDGDTDWLQMPGGCFLADPCWIAENDGLFLAEQLKYRQRRGRLVICRARNGRAEIISELRLPPVHLSYPMAYEVGGTRFIVPETAQLGRVSRYDLDDSGQVIGERLLVDARKLVDPTLFEDGGRWWMLATTLRDWNCELVVLSSPSVDGPWREMAYSPIPLANARGAGKVIRREGKLYWPTQHNDKRYGGGIIMRRIDRIDDKGLDQQIVATVLPDPAGKFRLGTHTLGEGQGHYLIDGVRSIIRPTKPADVAIAHWPGRRHRDSPAG